MLMKLYKTDCVEFMIYAVKSKKSKWVFNVNEDLPYHRALYQVPITNNQERLGHPTQKPVLLLEQLLLLHSNAGDMIFDPFMGVGSTGQACKNLKRNFVGCELDNTYYRTAVRRLVC